MVWWLINRPKAISFFSFSRKNCTPSTSNASDTKIQSEIVKQLYFSENPNKLKGSGYKRIGKHYLCVSLVTAFLLDITIIPSILGADVLTVVGAVKTIICSGMSSIDGSEAAILCMWSIVLVALTMLLNTIFKMLSSATIKSISAKDLAVELLDGKPDFNQLIDLLVFYFRKTRRRVIIFEDLDRFDDPRIFEELRQLNFTLNNRLKTFGKIKFVYAVKDDLFSKYVSEDTSIESIKTKVFDLIIPVIPFLAEINYDTAFQDEYKKTALKYDMRGISNVLSRHTSDMRVIKAIVNNFIVYNKTFSIESEQDFRNCAALAIIRVFEPSEFKLLPTGNSGLDKILKACHKERDKKIKSVDKKYTVDAKIKDHTNDIWMALRSYGNTIPANYRLQSITIDGSAVNSSDAEALVKIYHAKTGARINWTYQNKELTVVQIKEIFNQFVSVTPQEMADKETEIRKVAERDSFEFYDELKNDPEENNPDAAKIITELVENGFVTEDYLRFTAGGASRNISVNRAKRYIFNHIRGQERDASYNIDPDMAKIIMDEIDNTDLASTGLYNYDLFDFIIKNIDIYSNQLLRILLNAKADLEKFMNFFDGYCHKYKDELENEDCIGLGESTISNFSKTIPPAFLVMKLAKMYPKELMTTVTWSSLGDTHAKETIYSIAIVSFENPLELAMEKSDRSFLTYYADTIVKNENGKENLFKLYVANDVSVNNLGYFGVSNDEIRKHLSRIAITINEQNVAALDDDILMEYIATRQLTSNDFAIIMKSNKRDTKQYLVKNIEKVIAKDDLPNCLQKAATYIYENKIVLSLPELLQYAGKTSSKHIIGIMLVSNLTKEEAVTVMQECKDSSLSKIGTPNSLIFLDANDKCNKYFAEKLEALGLARRQKSHKDKNIIRLQVI